MAKKKLSMKSIRQELQEFANKHKVIFEDKGEVGFGRPCVGFLYGDNYVDHNPRNQETFKPIPEYADERLYAHGAPDAYHKHDCLAVLVHRDNYNEALRQLHNWIRHIESLGKVVMVFYNKGTKDPLQAFLIGYHGMTITIKNKDRKAKAQGRRRRLHNHSKKEA